MKVYDQYQLDAGTLCVAQERLAVGQVKALMNPECKEWQGLNMCSSNKISCLSAQKEALDMR